MSIRLLPALSVVTALGLAPHDAAACACCDGFTNITVHGWSKTGKSVLVSRSGVISCEAFSEQRVLRLGKRQPTRCFDLFVSTRPIPCDKLGTHAFPIKGKEKPSTLGALFPRKAPPLAAQRVRVRNRRAKKGSWRTKVEVQAGEKWRRVWRGSLAPYTPDDPSGKSRPATLDVKATIYPAPRGRWALLVLRDYDSAPGIGHREESVHWVRLPPNAALKGKDAP